MKNIILLFGFFLSHSAGISIQGMINDLYQRDVEWNEIQQMNIPNDLRWPTDDDGLMKVPYSISPFDFSSSQMAHIEETVKDMNSKLADIKIIPRTNETDYVQVISGNGCWSHLGKTGGEQELSVQRNGCLSIGTIQHEFMHAARFTHEHNHEDNDTLILESLLIGIKT